jgi:hypothetical protein
VRWTQDDSGRVHTPFEPVVLAATLALIPVLILEADALVYVRDFAGHESLQTTETYVHKIESPSVTAAAAKAMAGGQA